MSDYHRTKGFVISKSDFKEADQFFDVYTFDFGKVKVLGRAIRKIKSKLRPGIAIFNLSEIEFVNGKAFKTLTDTILVEKFEGIKKSPGKLRVAFKMAGAMDMLINGSLKDEKLFYLLAESLSRLNRSIPDRNYCSLIYYYFFWNMICILGFQLDFYNCGICKKELFSSELKFCPDHGGVSCGNCGNVVENNPQISESAIKILRFLMRRDWRIISRLKIEEEHVKELEEITNEYFNCLKSHLRGDCNNF